MFGRNLINNNCQDVGKLISASHPSFPKLKTFLVRIECLKYLTIYNVFHITNAWGYKSCMGKKSIQSKDRPMDFNQYKKITFIILDSTFQLTPSILKRLLKQFPSYKSVRPYFLHVLQQKQHTTDWTQKQKQMRIQQSSVLRQTLKKVIKNSIRPATLITWPLF